MKNKTVLQKRRPFYKNKIDWVKKALKKAPFLGGFWWRLSHQTLRHIVVHHAQCVNAAGYLLCHVI